MQAERAAEVERIFAIGIREATPDDVGYVLSTFERSLRAEYKDAENQDYQSSVKRFLNNAIDEGAEILIAHAPTEPTVIWGWVMVLGRVVLYAYTKGGFRERRICARLLARFGIDTREEMRVAFMTNEARRLKYMHKKPIRHVPRI